MRDINSRIGENALAPFRLIQLRSKILKRDLGLTHNASTRFRGGDGFQSQLKTAS